MAFQSVEVWPSGEILINPAVGKLNQGLFVIENNLAKIHEK